MRYVIFFVILMLGCGTDEDDFSCDDCGKNFTCNIEETACECKAGYEGDQCQIDRDNCADVTCQNGGSCIDELNGYHCECPNGYNGDHCETDIDDCAKNPCQNGGSCIDEINGYHCACGDTYEGDNCEIGYFVTTWKTDNEGRSEDHQVAIWKKHGPDIDLTYNYDIDCNGDGIWEAIGVTENYICEYETAGTYTIWIRGVFPAFYQDYGYDRKKILSIDQWGTIEWTDMDHAFYQCENMVLKATDAPDLSQVTSIESMLAYIKGVEGSVDHWNLGHITNIEGVFERVLTFNKPVNSWDVSSVTNMDFLFFETSFNQPVDQWDVSNVTNMRGIFSTSPFNQDISMWETGQVTDMSDMFSSTPAFNQNIGGWDVSRVTDMSHMFYDATVFNADISSWSVGSVTTMERMFVRAEAFDQPIGSWNVSNVTNMDSLFYETPFNHPLGQWDVSSVTSMKSMFRHAEQFNQDISMWNVSRLENMEGMFQQAHSFNQGLSKWDVSHVTNMERVFYYAFSFNQDISMWDVSGVVNMRWMFAEALSFNQDLSSWEVDQVTSCNYLDQKATSWLLPRPNVSCLTVVDGCADTPCLNGATCVDTIDAYLCICADGYGGENCKDGYFVTTWKTDNSGVSADNQVTIPFNPEKYNYYNVDCDNDGIFEAEGVETSEYTCTYDTPGTYRIQISGPQFFGLYFQGCNEGDGTAKDCEKLISVDQWGTYHWVFMDYMFYNCKNMVMNTTDLPDLWSAYKMDYMFYGATSFNTDISGWDTWRVESMDHMFDGASSFNQDLSGWNVEHVTTCDGFSINATSWVLGLPALTCTP